MRSRRSNPFAVSDIIDGINREYEEQFFAQVAVLSCQVSLTSIRKGIANYIISTYKNPKSKYEWNKERVRDFRVSKGEILPATVEQIAEELETYGKASYELLQTDPVPFIRNYKHKIFHETMKMLNPLHSHFHNIIKLDLSNQLIGDEKLNELCNTISKSSMKYINISGNNITSTGLKSLSTIIRSLHLFEDLNISKNKITDDGISYLFSDNTYSSTLKSLNCSYNPLNSKSAYYIGLQYHSNRNTCLNELILGGKVGIKGWGDDFLYILLYSFIEYKNIKQLKKLIIADFGLTDHGLNCISMFLLCNNIELYDINISHNSFKDNIAKKNFIAALRLNRSLGRLTTHQCGFSEIQLNQIIYIINSSSSSSSSSNNSNSSSCSDSSNNHCSSYNNNTNSNHSNTITTTTPTPSQIHLKLIKYNKTYSEYNRGNYKLSYFEQIALSYCIAYTYNICKHTYHKIKISFIKNNSWRIQKPCFWLIPKNNIEYNSDIMNNILILFQNTQIILPNIIKNSLNNINKYIKYSDILLEALQLSKNLSKNPNTIVLNKNMNVNNGNNINNIIYNINNNIIIYENFIKKYQKQCVDINNILVNEIELFVMNGENILKIAKKIERKNIIYLINDICNNRMSTDAILFCIEDYNSVVIEYIEVLERYIGVLNMQKLLYFYLVQENTRLNDHSNTTATRSNKYVNNNNNTINTTIPTTTATNTSTSISTSNNNKEIMDFNEYVCNNIPYFTTLQSTVSFIHYFYLSFTLDKNNHDLLQNTALQQLEDNMPIFTTDQESMPMLSVDHENEKSIDKKTNDNEKTNVKDVLNDDNNNKERRRSSNKRRSNIIMGKKGTIAK